MGRQIDPERLYTVGEVAQILRYSEKTIYRMIKEKKLIALRFPGKSNWRIKGEELIHHLQFIDKSET